MTGIRSYMRSVSCKRIVLIVSSIFICMLFFVSFMFPDIMETTRDGMTLWDAMLDGRLREFYIMNENVIISERFGTSSAAIYDFPVYLIFAIWNLPLWIYEQLTGAFALDRFIGIIWAKSISIPFLIGIFGMTVKIGRKITSNKFPFDLALLMFNTSVLLFVPVLIMGQYDSMCLLFILLGIDAYISERNRAFIMWFGIAAPFKLFALFVLIPLLLLKEKRILIIIEKLLLGCSFLIFCKLVQKYFFVVSETGTEYLSGHFLTFIFQSQEGFLYSSSSVFVIAFLAVCLYCYFCVNIEHGKLGIWAVYASFLGLSSFFITSLTHPQWSLLLLPFVVLLVLCCSENNRKTGLLISTIFSAGLLLAEIIFYSWVFNIRTSAYTLAGKVFYNGTDDVSFSVRNLIESKLPGIDINYFNMAGGGIFVAGMVFFLYWAHPNSKKDKFVCPKDSIEFLVGIRLLLLIIAGGLIVALML